MERISNNYFSIAVDDLKYLLNTYRIYPNYRHCCLNSHQVVEKILKYLIVISDIEDSVEILGSHNLKRLYLSCNKIYTEFNVIKNGIYQISGYYFDTRYPGSEFFLPQKEDADYAIKIAIECYKIACNVINKVERNDIIDSELLDYYNSYFDSMDSF